MSPRAAWRLGSLGFEDVYDYAPGKADWTAAGLPTEGEEADTATLRHAARRDAPTCPLDEPAGAALARAREEGWDQVVVATSGRVVLGRLRARDVEGRGDRPAGSVMQEGPSTFRLNVSVVEMARYMGERGRMRDALVTDPEGRLYGVAYREDLERLLEEVHDHQHDHPAGGPQGYPAS
jgi:CBS domain-containing protein